MTQEAQYLPDSPVGMDKEHIEKMAKAHAAYVCAIMNVVINNGSGDDWEPDQVMAIIESQYTTAFIHGFKHGVEDVQVKPVEYMMGFNAAATMLFNKEDGHITREMVKETREEMDNRGLHEEQSPSSHSAFSTRL